MGVDGIRQRLRSALPAAMKARDAAATSALRSALAAIDNAEAVTGGAATTAAPATTSEDFAGTVAGLGAAEVPRRSLTEAEAEAIVRVEIAERLAAAAGYAQAGHDSQATRLRAEASILGTHLAGR